MKKSVLKADGVDERQKQQQQSTADNFNRTSWNNRHFSTSIDGHEISYLLCFVRTSIVQQ